MRSYLSWNSGFNVRTILSGRPGTGSNRTHDSLTDRDNIASWSAITIRRRCGSIASSSAPPWMSKVVESPDWTKPVKTIKFDLQRPISFIVGASDTLQIRRLVNPTLLGAVITFLLATRNLPPNMKLGRTFVAVLGLRRCRQQVRLVSFFKI